MNQPTDRLGQPLSVGDWVRAPDALPGYRDDTYPVIGFENDSLTGNLCCHVGNEGYVRLIADCDTVVKINPKPETTTWDKCVWAPESINTTL